jgi:hypothetical protein
MKISREQAAKKSYHSPEVKDYGNISKITAGSGGGRGEGGGRT